MGLSSLSADSVPCTTFTPQEALVELLRIALAKDSVLVMTAPTDKPFLFTWLIKEWSWTVRQNVASILLVVHHERQAFLWRELLSRSTDLTPVQLYQHKQNNIFVTSLDTLAEFVRQDSGPPDWFRVSLCIVDNAHLLLCHPRGADVVKTLQGPSVRYKSSRFVALTSRVVCSAETRLSQIDANLDQLERFYSCPTEASCDLMSLLRFIANPAIKIIQHLPSRPFGDAEMEIRAVIQRLKSFLQNHVYSLLDIYGEEFQDLIEDIPDPTEAPLNIVNDFLLVMDTMGMWCAERAALIFLIQIEKLKMREKYERHYLLLSALYTEMVLIRKICCNAFGSMPDREKIHHFSSAKLLKLVDILRQYKPAHIQPSGCKRAPIKGESETQQPNNGHGRRSKHFYTSYEDPNALCGVIFVKNKFVAKLLYHFLKDLSRSEDAFSFLMPQYAVELPSSVSDDYDLELERRKQEDALRKFRMKESNLLVSNSLLEVGIDMVKCNLVIAFDAPDTFHAYAQYKVKAKGNSRHSHLLFFTEQSGTDQLVSKLSIYRVVEERLKARCILAGPDLYDVHQADLRDGEYSPFITKPSHAHNKYNHVASQGVTLKSAIFYLNRYCAKLPSDTFTRLTPLYYCTHVQSDYQCSLLLPINSPLKDLLMGPVMPSVELANRAAALEALKRLHEIHELDDYMSPVGKDGHRRDPELKKAEVDESKKAFPYQNHDIKDGRPGTTKRRQYYFKQVAKCLSSPPDGDQHFLYAIRLRLTCPVPDDQNTRGRPIFDPVTSKQNFGILCTERLPTICEFPIYTRSGELFVQLELLDDNARLSPQEKDLILGFHKYTFSTVLRLDKYPMKFSPTTAENKIIVLPLRSEDSAIDWDFLQKIAVHHHAKLEPVSEEARRSFTFDENSFEDAVVMPWYRNQDQPQYFYVAEVCHHLSPRSDFPGQGFDTFEKYYQSKYNISIQNLDQPLLDVDHTSARLNFLTPRYVNRKGVALPTSSEETKRAKRENLEQKQILIPELCSIHPFPATLWKHAVCLPCIIYRMNELLIADQLRALVAKEMGFVQVELQPGTQWPPLTFGWTLAEVLKNRNDELDGKKSAGPVNKAQDSGPAGRKASAADESLSCGLTLDGIEISDATNEDELGSLSNKLLYKLTQEESKLKLKSNLEIGTWSNDMADDSLLHAPEEPLREVSEEELDELEWMDPNKALPDNLTFIDKSSLPKNSKGGRDWGTGIAQKTFRVGSPTFFSNPNIHIPGLVDDMNGYSCSDSDEDDDEPELYSDDLSSSEIIGSGAVRIQFRGLNMAEAIEDEDDNIKRVENLALERAQEAEMLENAVWEWPDADDPSSATVQSFEADVSLFRQRLLSSESFIMKADEDFNRQQCSQSICLSMTPKRPVMRIGELNDLEDMLQHQGISPSVVSEASVDQEIATGQNYQLSFQFDHQPDLYNHPGPSPSLILQALTMSNSNDAINLERLETIGDSFLKYAITSYLFCMNPSVHEGRLSHLRSKQVSNLNLYRLGRQKGLGQCMVASKFDPHDNWLPPCYHIPQELEQALIMSGVPASKWNMADFPDITDMNWEQICSVVREKSGPSSQNVESLPSFVPYNLLTQHSIPDKSIADCVEALIGAYLTACGSQGALMFMTWLGLTVLPRPREGHTLLQTQLPRPRSPLLDTSPEATARLHHLLHGFDKFEQLIGYQFRDKSYLLQAFSHASYYINRFTDCYQRLEFLGDAVLDYLITRHLFEDPRQHSPGALTDLRSALVNNTIFASLAVKFQFHKYFKFFSPGLQAVVNRFVKIQAENNYAVADDFYFMEEDENDEAEDIEVPKALGDIFESVAGAIYLDSGLSLDSVWSVYYRMMKEEIDKYSENVPKSPIRELLELEPETAKFGKPEKLADGKRVRVSVEVFGKGVFKGIGRNYRIAKCTAAKCALRAIKKRTSTAH